MRLTIDTDDGSIAIGGTPGRRVDLYSKEGFEILSSIWLKVGWNEKITYTYTWFGRPIIQLPDDMVRLQEVLYTVRPDVIVETGVAHGGSLVFHASLCKAFGGGRVVGVDIEIRPHNRNAIEMHPLADLITLIEGSSVDPAIVATVKRAIQPGERALVILDSNHSAAHVHAELEAYAPLVAAGSYIVVTDGIMQELCDVPRGRPAWDRDNPITAVDRFLAAHSEFVQEQPAWLFNESRLDANLTHWPRAYLRRMERS